MPVVTTLRDCPYNFSAQSTMLFLLPALDDISDTFKDFILYT